MYIGLPEGFKSIQGPVTNAFVLDVTMEEEDSMNEKKKLEKNMRRIIKRVSARLTIKHRGSIG